MITISERALVKMLAVAVVKAGGQRAWARKHNLTGQYVCTVLHERQAPGKKICRALGMRRVIRYEPIDD